jgi:hypothetical protein
MKVLKLFFTLLFVFYFSTTSIYAAHIIGGDVSYECLGNDDYKIQMKIYRDADAGGAQFDGIPGSIGFATITIFNGEEIQELITLEAPIVTVVPADINNPCPNLPTSNTVEKALYEFTINLPFTTDVYTISYQRCCLASSASNVLEPTETGLTFTININSVAQDLCNNSPVFNAFTINTVKAGEEMDLNFSALDADGDLLVYELCSPLIGGGPENEQIGGIFSIAPHPESPPPYTLLTFPPAYSAFQPLGENANLTINSETGIVSGLPIIIGDYMLGVCVSEYRNGNLLSVSQKVLRIRVTDCTSANEKLTENESIRLFPNPVKNEMYLSFESENITNSEINVQIFNQDGRIMKEFSNQKQTVLSYPLSNISTGVYYVKIYEDEVFKGVKLLLVQ